MYLYSNIVGTFVFNQNIKIREKILFSKKDLKKNYKLLFEGKILDVEKEILQKFKQIKDLRQEYDETVMQKVYIELSEFEKEFYENNIYITKLQIKDSVTNDLLIIQASNSINEIKKAINLLSKRLREWYSYVLPEVEDALEDNINFVERIYNDSSEKLIKDFKLDITMGQELSKDDMNSLKSLALAILELEKQRQVKEIYLEKLIKQNCPNLNAVAGHLTGGKLLALAGSLRNMVMMPSSTIQLLGAEKALFMHMIKGTKSPKHGVIIEHPIVQRVDKKDKGKASRALADKISLAVKLDFFKGKFMGDELRKELEARFK